VADALPMVAVLSAAGDPAHLVRTLLRGGWFDTLELTETDRERPELYRTRALRAEFGQGFGSTEEYLGALDIRCLIEPATQYTVARIAQLSGRTNQFNLTGKIFDQAETARMSEADDALVASLSVSDRFGDEGVVGAAWLCVRDAEWEVLNLVLSCRVLGRGVELAFAAWLAERARTAGARRLVGRYVATKRNGAAADFWTRAGLRPDAAPGHFHLDLSEPITGPAWIRILERSDA
jgi:FkbH-like protein